MNSEELKVLLDNIGRQVTVISESDMSEEQKQQQLIIIAQDIINDMQSKKNSND